LQTSRRINELLSNKTIQRILPPLRYGKTADFSRSGRPQAVGLNGVADEPRWLRPPAAAEPADGTDGPAGPGSSATPLGAKGPPSQ